jgi:hypothetical protein
MVVSHVISELNKMITNSLGVFVQILVLFPLLMGNLRVLSHFVNDASVIAQSLFAKVV